MCKLRRSEKKKKKKEGMSVFRDLFSLVPP